MQRAAEGTGSLAFEFFNRKGEGRALWPKAKKLRPMSEEDERLLLQHVLGCFPVQGWLSKVGKSQDDRCKICGKARESLGHLHSKCGPLQPNLIAAHHQIWKSFRDSFECLRPKGCRFWWETEVRELPFDIDWGLGLGSRNRPDGIAWNSSKRQLKFLEFSRPMDWTGSLVRSRGRKVLQYREEEACVREFSRRRPSEAIEVETLPFIVGVRGSIDEAVVRENLRKLDVRAEKVDSIMAGAIRSAWEALTDMVKARKGALYGGPNNGAGAT